MKLVGVKEEGRRENYWWRSASIRSIAARRAGARQAIAATASSSAVRTSGLADYRTSGLADYRTSGPLLEHVFERAVVEEVFGLDGGVTAG